MSKDWGVYIKSMAKVHGKDVLPEVKLRKPRAKETKPRKEYDLQEARFRRDVIRHLRKKGCVVKRIENSINSSHSIPDLWVFCPEKQWGGWVELKSEKGIIRDGQTEFAVLCRKTKVNHIFARSIDDVRVCYE